MRASALRPAGRGHFRALVVVAVLVAVLAGCASQPPAYQYFEPSALPPARYQFLVAGSPRQVQDRIIAELRASPFEVTQIDPAGRYVVAEYRGDPGPYLDCGLLLTVSQGASGETGAMPAVVAEREIRNWNASYERTLRLDGRLVVTIAPRGSRQSLVAAHGTYVLTKMLRDDEGELSGRETIAFTSGQRAAFRKGTTCQPTGAFERTATAALGATYASLPDTTAPVVPALGEPTRSTEELELEQTIQEAVVAGSCAEVTPTWLDARRVRLSGVASDLFAMDAVVNAIDLANPELRIDNRIEVLSKPACEAYGLALSHAGVRADRRGSSGARLQVLNLEDGDVAAGTPLRLALDVPEDHPNVLVAHFRNDGTVDTFQIDAPRNGSPRNGWTVDAPERLGPPYGRDLILAIATPEPLFAGVPPRQADAFVPELRSALERLPAGVGGPRSACAVIATEGGGNGVSIAPGLDIC